MFIHIRNTGNFSKRPFKAVYWTKVEVLILFRDTEFREVHSTPKWFQVTDSVVLKHLEISLLILFHELTPCYSLFQGYRHSIQHARIFESIFLPQGCTNEPKEEMCNLVTSNKVLQNKHFKTNICCSV